LKQFCDAVSIGAEVASSGKLVSLRANRTTNDVHK